MQISLRGHGSGGNLNDISEPITDDDTETDPKKRKRKDSIQYGYASDGYRKRNKERRKNDRMMKCSQLIIVEG